MRSLLLGSTFISQKGKSGERSSGLPKRSRSGLPLCISHKLFFAFSWVGSYPRIFSIVCENFLSSEDVHTEKHSQLLWKYLRLIETLPVSRCGLRLETKSLGSDAEASGPNRGRFPCFLDFLGIKITHQFFVNGPIAALFGPQVTASDFPWVMIVG
jgi:hypothetical protein